MARSLTRCKLASHSRGDRVCENRCDDLSPLLSRSRRLSGAHSLALDLVLERRQQPQAVREPKRAGSCGVVKAHGGSCEGGGARGRGGRVGGTWGRSSPLQGGVCAAGEGVWEGGDAQGLEGAEGWGRVARIVGWRWVSFSFCGGEGQLELEYTLFLGRTSERLRERGEIGTRAARWRGVVGDMPSQEAGRFLLRRWVSSPSEKRERASEK